MHFYSYYNLVCVQRQVPHACITKLMAPLTTSNSNNQYIHMVYEMTIQCICLHMRSRCTDLNFWAFVGFRQESLCGHSQTWVDDEIYVLQTLVDMKKAVIGYMNSQLTLQVNFLTTV